jgi:hypothetical protein
VGISTEVEIGSVLGGLLLHDEFEEERKSVKETSQLVLTDFTSVELREFYDVEKMAYEIWRTSATLRIVGKGASIVVGVAPDYFADNRSTDLDQLVKSFDARYRRWDNPVTTATGVVVPSSLDEGMRAGSIFIPTYNLGHVSTEDFSEPFKSAFNLDAPYPSIFNFLWLPYQLRQYRSAHFRFSQEFGDVHGVSLDSVLLLIATLCVRVLSWWIETEGLALIRYWQRAYEGPFTREYIMDEIEAFLPSGADILGIDRSEATMESVHDAIMFFELSQENRIIIDLPYPGPHYLFLPFGADRLFIDYAWLSRRLYSLFFGVSPSDQTFKGKYLEEMVRRGSSVLPISECRSLHGEARQIDAAFSLIGRLVIVECKVVGWSIGFDRGNPEAIAFRKRIIDEALDEVNEKASWLAQNPVGTNYDITGFEDITPIVVTPFAEYIPSLHERYWLTESLPRVCTAEELRQALEDDTLRQVSQNLVSIAQGK